MRFSSIFHLTLQPHQPARSAPTPPEAISTSAPTAVATPLDSAEPAQDLDQRVRMIGEWQLGEG